MRRNLLILAFAVFLAALAARPAQAQVPSHAYISGVTGHAQIYSLSCESRSAADWAAYWGVAIDETEFVDSLPRSDNPNEGFVGYPDDPWGYTPPNSYGVHAEPIAALLREYGLDAHAGTGLSWNEARSEIAAGRPVIVWVIGSIWAGTAKDYETEDGATVTVANNEHTMILIGYDENRVHLVDALTGYTITHTVENFLTSWAVLDNMAVTGEGSGNLPEGPGQGDPGEGYTVQRGDTLAKVADRFGLYWPDLAAWNNISYPYLIYTGQILQLSGQAEVEVPEETEEPAPSEPETYTVTSGDYLLKIARELDVDWARLARFNELSPPFAVHAGDVLTLPGEDEVLPELDVPKNYTAAGNESLVAIAHYYGLDWVKLAAINELDHPYILSPGQSIRLR